MFHLFLLSCVLSISFTHATTCNIDLTTKGLPVCTQACPEWCWATVISEIKEYYHVNNNSNDIPPATAKCHNYECKVVSDVRSSSCCQNSTECNSAGSGMGCGNPSSAEEILQGFQLELPAKKWVHLSGRPGYPCTPADGCWPKEPVLQDLLRSNTPVARATHGHITTIAGCRTVAGVVEYRVLDSLKDPSVEIWMNFTLLTLGPPPGQKPYGDGPWQNTYYTNTSL